jgi:DNA-binding CsgD family transcriptional regulator
MKSAAIDARSQQMLELLSQGASAQVIARKLGYSEGTMRVYLHNLYKVIGVRNKTEAVIWHLNRTQARTAVPAEPPPSMPVAGESFAEMAMGEDLYTALGVMSSFLGPYGHMWEAGLRLKGGAIDDKLLARRAQARLLWRALLRGDFAYGKFLHDEQVGERLAFDAPSDAVLLAALLQIGGYSSAAERLTGQLGQKRKGVPGISPREATLLRSLNHALYGTDSAALSSLYQLATENGMPILKQVAMVTLFHAYRARRDLDRARATANAIWAEAETARQQLDAMGVRPLGRETPLPCPTKSVVREPGYARERVAATR